MIPAPETRLHGPAHDAARAGAAWRPRRLAAAAALIAGAALALADSAAHAQASAPAASASAAAPSHAAAKARAAAKKKKKKAKAIAARDDDAPDSFLYGRRDDVLAFAAQVADDRGLDRAWVEDQLARARYLPGVAKAIMPGAPGTAKNWAAYRARFIEPKRLAAGVQWWQAHAAALADAQQRYGVPAEIVVGIIGVETFYGRMTGHYRVLDSLATLAFDFPTGRSDRSAFYRSELRAYLVWCALEGRDADTTRGSFAGAIGWPQFMPSSLLKYAVDFDRDGHVDLSTGDDDVVGSVASYLATFGWQRDMPIYFPVLPPPDPDARARLVAADIVPTFTVAQLTAAGAQLPDAARDFEGSLAFIELQNGDAAPSYVAGTRNFYAVTRYNWSSYYAMAVIDLAAALKREMAFGPAARLPDIGQTGSQAPSTLRQAQP
jgi:membrane-bound lytic murein transglycosylase B